MVMQEMPQRRDPSLRSARFGFGRPTGVQFPAEEQGTPADVALLEELPLTRAISPHPREAIGLKLEGVTLQNISLPEELQKILDQKIAETFKELRTSAKIENVHTMDVNDPLVRRVRVAQQPVLSAQRGLVVVDHRAERRTGCQIRGGQLLCDVR